MSDDVKWFRQRILAGTLRMLDDDDQARFDRLVESDAECEELYERLTERHADEAAPTSGHIPPEIAARWAAVLPGLRGLERAAVRHHLQGCETCRQALEGLGHAPEVPRDEALELDDESFEAFFPDRPR